MATNEIINKDSFHFLYSCSTFFCYYILLESNNNVIYDYYCNNGDFDNNRPTVARRILKKIKNQSD